MFFQVDDQLPVNAKVRRAIEDAMLGGLEGLAAMGMWTVSGAASQASLTDGVVSRADLYRIVLNPQLADLLAGHLVTAKLWHAKGHDCPRCPQPDEGPLPGEWIYHDWRDLGYNTAEQTKTTRRKRAELKDAALIAAVWARDCLDPSTPGIGRCRYCEVEVKRKTTVGDQRPTMDHVDPTKAIGIRNVVLACRACNQHKGARTPEQAGMTLHPAPRVALTAPEKPSARQATPEAPERPQEAPDATRPGTSQVDHRSKLSRTPTRAGAAGRGPWQGQGGVRVGSGEGEAGSPSAPTETKPLSRSARRRQRRKSTQHRQPDQVTPPVSGPSPGMDAGDHPPVLVPGTLGSPWHGWTGPPSTVTETTCPDHGLPEPCRRCPGGSP